MIVEEDELYYKEHIEEKSLFLRYYYRKDSNAFFLGIKITHVFSQIIVYCKKTQKYESIKFCPIVTPNAISCPSSSSIVNTSCLFSLSYNEWDFDLASMDLQSILSENSNLYVKHKTSIHRNARPPLEYELFDKFTIDDTPGFKEILTKVVDTYEKYITDSIPMGLTLSALSIVKGDQITVLPPKLLCLSFTKTDDNQLRVSTIDSCEKKNKKKTVKSTNASKTSLNSDFNSIFKKINKSKTGLICDSPETFFDVVWFCGDCVSLVDNIKVFVDCDEQDNKCFLSHIDESDDITCHIQYLFNIFLFQKKEKLNVSCESMNSSDFSKFLERELQSVIGSSFTKYIQETYKNNKKQITRFVGLVELTVAYMSNIFVVDKYKFLSFVESVYNMFDITGDLSNEETQKISKKRPISTRVDTSVKRQKLIPRSSKRLEKADSNHLGGAPAKETPLIPPDEPPVKTRLDMDSELQKDDSNSMLDDDTNTVIDDTHTVIKWNDDSIVDLPQSVKDVITDYVFQSYKYDENLKKNDLTPKKEITQLVENFMNSNDNRLQFPAFKKFKSSYDAELNRRTRMSGNRYGGAKANGMLIQLVMKACGINVYCPKSIPAGTKYYLKEK